MAVASCINDTPMSVMGKITMTMHSPSVHRGGQIFASGHALQHFAVQG